MLNRYGTAQQFIDTFVPALQIVAARHPARAYTGTAPTLQTVSRGYGEPTAIVWICFLLEDINLFAGVKDKLPVERQKALAALILTEYSNLKATELLLFFHRMKCGRYGRFYGSVDALTISSALLQFMDERRKEKPRYLSAHKAEPPRAPEPSGGITYDEYLVLKQKKQQSHDNK